MTGDQTEPHTRRDERFDDCRYTAGRIMSSANPEPSSARTPWFIWLCLVAAMAIFVLSVFVIYYRFVTTPETNCMIVVQGGKESEGYEVVVERVTTGDEGLRLSDTFSKANGESVRFFLPSATYKIEVWNTDKALLMTYRDEFVPPGHRLTLDVGRPRGAATLPGARGAAR